MVVLLIIILIILLAASVSVQKSYAGVTARELKRRARHGDQVSHMLYEVAQYDMELEVLLSLITSFWAALLFFMLIRHLPWWLAIILVIGTIVLAFSWPKGSRPSRWSASLLKILNPVLLFLLRYLRPVLHALSQLLMRLQPQAWHTGLYEKDDLLELLSTQAQQPDNRISEQELRIAFGALQFSDILIREVMIPRSVVVTVKSSDTIGPILLDELHKSGHSRFPVVNAENETIVGVLYMHDLVDVAHGGRVSHHMSKKVFYVHEDFTLGHALQAFLKTKHHLFIVVNEFEEYTGIITIEDILEKILGVEIVDEFDRYDDLREVAGLKGKKAIEQTKATEISSEVVES